MDWLGECILKLIQWKYGNVIPIQDLQNLEYDPGGTLCKCFRSLTTYSNTVILLAFSFAVVTASGQYVNNGVIHPYASNSSSPPLHPHPGTSLFIDESFALALDPSSSSSGQTPLIHSFSLYRSSDDNDDNGSSSLSSSNTFSNFNDSSKSSHISDVYHSISNSSSSKDHLNGTDTEFSSDVYAFSSTVAAIIVSMNDTSQIPRYSNRTPHIIETEPDVSSYFGVLSVILGLMILLTIVGKFSAIFFFPNINRFVSASAYSSRFIRGMYKMETCTETSLKHVLNAEFSYYKRHFVVLPTLN